MNKIARMLIALLALSAGAARAQDIECAKPAGRLDAVICADPEMRDDSDRIAAAYARGIAIWDGAIATYVRHDQQEWLTAFRTIETVEATMENDCSLSDRACIRTEMRNRVEEVESAAYVHSGVYRSAAGMKLLLQPGRAKAYRVRVYDPANPRAINNVTLVADGAATWEGSQYLVSVMGNADGMPLPADDGCTLRLQHQPLSIQIVQNGSCQGHQFAGVYDRLLDETLRGYEMELH